MARVSAEYGWWAVTGSNRRPSRCKRGKGVRKGAFPSVNRPTERERMANKANGADHYRTISIERRPVPGYRAIYDVDSTGRVFSLARTITKTRHGSTFKTDLTERVLRPHVDRYGYEVVCLHKNGEPWRVGVHRVVCLAFHGPMPEKGMHAAHINGDKRDNRPENLRWATVAENNEDRRRHGVHPMGTVLPHTKLTPHKVREVVRRCQSGESQSAVARDMGVSNVAISKVMLGKSWRQVTGFAPHPDILAEIERINAKPETKGN